VSVATGGGQADYDSGGASISADGRYVAFCGSASNLVPGDTNRCDDIFVHDRVTGQTTRVSVATGGGQANNQCGRAAISADGRYVAFNSYADNLVPGDTNSTCDIFVHDRLAGKTTRVSVATGGDQADGSSAGSSMSADGRYVAFDSGAENLVPGGTNTEYDVFVHDRVTGQTTRVSVATNSPQADAYSHSPSISADGRYVAFQSWADNLVPGDTNWANDIFVHDRVTGQTTRVSVATGGLQADAHSAFTSISADGRYVAFSSDADNLVPGDTNDRGDVFVHDRVTGETTRVSVATGGGQASGGWSASISANGRYVAFCSEADNLVAGDTNGARDVFVHDRVTGQTTRVSVSTGGEQANGRSQWPYISADGRCVAFGSWADNLVPGDTNGKCDVFVHERVAVADEVTITAGPLGDPNPVASGGTVDCSVTASDSRGHALTYEWTAKDGEGEAAGSFDDATKQNPVWTAPANTTDSFVEYTLAVTVTCSEGKTASGSFQEQVNPLGLGDIDDNGKLDALDLVLFIRAWRQYHAGETDWDRRADLNGNAVVDSDDALLMLSAVIGNL